MKNTLAITLAGCLSLLSVIPLAAEKQDPFAADIRPTDPLTPDEERESFTLPPGFEVQLVASEPDILKPMNIAFDDEGRLWVSGSTEYPFPVEPGEKGRDNIKVLEDTDGDGRADEITTFVDGLNIPIGLYPYKDGVIAFSIPYIWHFRDTDGDGKADVRKKLYGPMGWKRDAHGLNNGFRRGFDGWLYACHGFNNHTRVAGDDGHEIVMQSGNTYRMRLDGSRVEHFTWGQVNPFGMTMDPLFNLFTADCHSKQITHLLRGGYYPSFGKPHGGLGFVPPMMGGNHGSTAISGIARYAGTKFPEDYRGDVFTGNVMTSRVNRDALVYRGSTILAERKPDFVKTSDPWFRPVDIRMGPDGALYIADFYNKIIGHYEVPLDHPKRDRYRGRIWRIVYTGDEHSGERRAESRGHQERTDLSSASVDKLIGALEHPNLMYRRLAMHRLVDGIGQPAVGPLKKAFRDAESPRLRSHAVWILHRLGALPEELLVASAEDAERMVRVHAMKVLSETPGWSEKQRQLALAGLRDEDAFVRRAAADAVGQHPRYENIRPLLDLLHSVPEKDKHLRHMTRIALRNQLRPAENFEPLGSADLSETDSRAIAGVCLALDSPQAASFLLRHVRTYDVQHGQLTKYLEHAARFVPSGETDVLAGFVRENFAGDPDFQWRLFDAVYKGVRQRGGSPGEAVTDWGRDLARDLLASIDDASRSWVNVPVPGAVQTDNPWVLRRRPSADGKPDALFLSSRPRGERLTGVLRSRSFAIPETLSFYLAGHDGFPQNPRRGDNFVRLRDAGTDELLAETPPPRNDTAQQITWTLKEHAGKQGYLELVDGNDVRAYAWLAAGRFEPPVVPLPKLEPHRVTARRRAAAMIAGRLKFEGLRPQLVELLTGDATGPAARKAAAEALVSIAPDSRVAALVPLVGDPALPDELRRRIGKVVARRDPVLLRKTLAEAVRVAPRRLQVPLAQTLAGDETGAKTLFSLIEEGHASPRLLQNETVRQKLLAVRPDAADRIEELTAALPPRNQEIEKRIAERKQAFRRANPSAERGQKVFEKNCAACHQIEGQGAVVGPQLDGIGTRGLERLIEDVLDPNRNVDVNFRTTTLLLKNGQVKTGLFRRAEGETLVFVDREGKEFTVQKDEIAERKESRTSLMPQNVDEIVSGHPFHDLMAYLLRQREKPSPTGANPDAAVSQ